MTAASGCAPPMPPSPAVRIHLPREIAAVMLAAELDEGLVGALNDSLAADVDPGAGGHLAVHHQTLAIELAEMFPVRPMRHQIGIGDQHARRVGMGAKDADRFARLHQQRLVAFQPLQRRDDAIETFPVARRAADAAIDHEFARAFPRRRDRDCSSACASALRSARTWPIAGCRARHGSRGHCRCGSWSEFLGGDHVSADEAEWDVPRHTRV